MTTNLGALLGIDLPLIQAPMAGVQGSALALAVSNAGAPGSPLLFYTSDAADQGSCVDLRGAPAA